MLIESLIPTSGLLLHAEVFQCPRTQFRLKAKIYHRERTPAKISTRRKVCGAKSGGSQARRVSESFPRGPHGTHLRLPAANDDNRYEVLPARELH